MRSFAAGDIDTLVCVPQHITRKDFFTSFYELLVQDPKVVDLHVRIGRSFTASRNLFDCRFPTVILLPHLSAPLLSAPLLASPRLASPDLTSPCLIASPNLT